jgi:hypothetical protein
MDLHEMPYRLKSARQKRRLVKKDRDKQLIQLDRHQTLLWKQKRELPMMPLAHPYQKGWKRFFVLRKDVQQSAGAGFYQGVLDKINTLEYYHDKSFIQRIRKKGRYHYEVRPQTLRLIYEDEWFGNKLKLTDAEKLCFYRYKGFSEWHGRVIVNYLFAEPWRFVLAVKPHIIYEVKMIDEVLEQEIKAIDNHIENNCLKARIDRLTRGRGRRRWYAAFFDKPKYINKLKNKPMYLIQEEYMD